MKSTTGLLLAIGLLLAGCTAGTAQKASSTEVPTVTARVLAAVLSKQTAAPSAAATASPGPTLAGLRPTASPSETLAGPAATEPPAATATPQPVPSPTALPVHTPTPSTSPSPTVTTSWWEVGSLLVGPGNPGRLYAFQREAGNLVVDPPGKRLLVSDDGGQTWVPFPGELPAAECLRSINMDYAQVDALYASTCQGLYRWSGSGWDLVSPQETTMVAVVYGQPQILWAASYPVSGPVVIRSDDGGATWNPAATNLVSFGSVAVLGIDPTDANRLYAIISPKYAGSYLRRGNSNGLWETMPTPNNNTVIDPGMAIDGPSGDLYVVTSLDNYQLWRSRNPGADLLDIRWELLYDFGPDTWAHLLAAGPGTNGPALYANVTAIRRLGGSSIEIGPAMLHRSVDGGQAWTALPIPSAVE